MFKETPDKFSFISSNTGGNRKQAKWWINEIKKLVCKKRIGRNSQQRRMAIIIETTEMLGMMS